MGFLYFYLSMRHFEITVVTNSSDLRNYHIKKTRPAWFYCMTTKHTSCDPYSTSLGCRRQPSLACHAWNHGKSQKSSPLSQQCRFHCYTWSVGESHYCVNSKGFMNFDTHTNEESMKINKNDCHYPTLLAFLPNILRSHMAVWLSFWKTDRSK